MMAEMTYKSLKKIRKIKEQIRYNTSYTTQSRLEDKLYKQLKKLAEEMIDSVQYVINQRGAYENAGWDEAGEFMDIVDGCSSNIIAPLRHNLQDYIEILINKLKY